MNMYLNQVPPWRMYHMVMHKGGLFEVLWPCYSTFIAGLMISHFNPNTQFEKQKN